MPDLTDELQWMADDAARQARPLTVADVIRRGDRRHRRSLALQSLGVLSVAGVVTAAIVAAAVLLPASHRPAPPGPRPGHGLDGN